MDPATLSPLADNLDVKSGRISTLLLVIFGILFGALGVDAVFKGLGPKPVIDGQQVDRATAKAFEDDVRNLVQGLKPGDPSSANMSYEPTTTGGKTFKSIMAENAAADAKFMKAQEKVYNEDMLLKLGSKDGRAELEIGLALLAPETDAYFDSSDESLERLQVLFGKEQMAPRVAQIKSETSEIRTFHHRVNGLFGKLVDFCEKEKATPSAEGPVFKNKSQIAQYDQIATQFDEAVAEMSKRIELATMRRSRIMQDALGRLDGAKR